MIEDFSLMDSVILPDTTVKLTITNPLLATWIKHGGPEGAGHPKAFVDRKAHQVRYVIKHDDLKEAVQLLKESLVMDGWMHDCWEHSVLSGSPGALVQEVNRSIQYINGLTVAYGHYDTLLIATNNHPF